MGICIIFVLPDFPHTWKRLTPEEKFVANRRMATDGSEADIDEAGGRSQMKGLKAAFTDPKVCIPCPRIACRSNRFDVDLHHCDHVPLHCRRDWLPELLPDTHRDAISKQRYKCVAPRGAAIHLYDALFVRTQLYFRQTQEPLLVLGVSHSDRSCGLLLVHVHEQLWAEIFQFVLAELRFCDEQHCRFDQFGDIRNNID